MKKYLIVIGVIPSAFLVLFLLVKILTSQNKVDKVTQSSDTTSSMDDHHKPPPPADDTIFKSLLGKPAPDFTLEAYDGRRISLKDLKGKKVALFFSEGAMCSPSCWDQMKAFSNDSYFRNNDIAVLTIVVDDKKTWEDATNQDVALKNVTVLLDTDKKVSQAYGALTVSSSMHRGEYPGHSYVILDKEEIVRETFDDPDMRVNNLELKEALNKIS